MTDLYHKAARDGAVDLLKTATKRDANRRDEDGMTPVHYAASCGNVEALRLLIGKGWVKFFSQNVQRMAFYLFSGPAYALS